MDLKFLDLPELRLKYYVFGSGGSPRILITAAIHGDEVTGVFAAYKLVEYLKQKGSVSGTAIIMPVVNVLGFNARTRFNPVDYVDMNRVFPEGTGSVITKKIVKFVWELASSSDYVLDLHCAGLNSYQYILALHKEFPKVREFADTIPWDTAVESTGTRGQLFVEATHKGIPAVIIETGGGDGYYDKKWGEELYRVTLGMLVNLGVVSDSSVSTYSKREKTYYGKLVHVKTPVEGFPEFTVEPGAFVMKGDVLSQVSGETIRSPVSGKVIRVERNTFVFSDSSVASIAPLEEQ